MSAAPELVDALARPSLRLVSPPAPLFAGPIVITDGHAPEAPADPPWGARVLALAANFHVLPPEPPRGKRLTARPSGSFDAPEWMKHATALARWIVGRASIGEVRAALAYEREAIGDIRSPLPRPLPKTPRFRPSRPTAPEPPAPDWSENELAAAGAIIESRCKGPLAERTWIELRQPPKRCRATSEIKVATDRAIERARRRLRGDACLANRRGRMPFEENDESEK